MRFLLFFLIAMTPAFALIGGKDNRNPEGFRKHVVTIRMNAGGHCSGVVISKQLILTAAHCFQRPGGAHVGYLNAAFLTQRIEVAAVILHPKFNPVGAYTKYRLHDLALVRLAYDIPDALSPVSFPLQPPKLLETVTLVGFGLSDGNRTDSALVLRELPLKIEEYAKDRGEINLTQTGFKMFAPGHGSCRGDSGGPALRFNETTKKHEIVGISSWSSGQSKANACGVKSIYTDTYNEYDWIYQVAKNWGINLP